MSDGFLGRWSRRKADAREGRNLAEPERPARPATQPGLADAADTKAAAVDARETGVAAPAAPPPTLDDVTALTPASDFRRFVAPDVAPEVRNAAVRKLFADPHFNVMDGLDTYIEDFNQTTPLPLSTIRQMAQSAFLGLAEPQPEPAQEARRTIAQGDEEASVASPRHAEPEPAPEPEEVEPHDENSDLRLQSLDTPGSPSPQPGT